MKDTAERPDALQAGTKVGLLAKFKE